MNQYRCAESAISAITKSLNALLLGKFGLDMHFNLADLARNYSRHRILKPTDGGG